MKDVLQCLKELVAELDRLPNDHPQWEGSPMRDECVQAIEAAQQSVHADAGDSAVSTSSLQASALSTSQAESAPTQRG